MCSTSFGTQLCPLFCLSFCAVNRRASPLQPATLHKGESERERERITVGTENFSIPGTDSFLFSPPEKPFKVHRDDSPPLPLTQLRRDSLSGTAGELWGVLLVCDSTELKIPCLITDTKRTSKDHVWEGLLVQIERNCSRADR